jgi:hypothetical protein
MHLHGGTEEKPKQTPSGKLIFRWQFLECVSFPQTVGQSHYSRDSAVTQMRISGVRWFYGLYLETKHRFSIKLNCFRSASGVLLHQAGECAICIEELIYVLCVLRIWRMWKQFEIAVSGFGTTSKLSPLKRLRSPSGSDKNQLHVFRQ